MDYSYFTTLTSNTTYTIPQSSWYRFHVVGKGGDGGDGGLAQKGSSYHRGYWCFGGGGGSGATGAYAIHDVYCEAGQTVTITVNNTYSRLLINGQYVTANAGTTGGNGGDRKWNSSQAPAGTPGAAANTANVTATGGNVLNQRGLSNAAIEYKWEYKYDNVGFGADAPNRPNSLMIYNPQTGAKGYKGCPAAGGSAVSNARSLGGAGAGGSGGIGDGYNTKEWFIWNSPRDGGKGGQGGVVIEKSVNEPPTAPGYIAYDAVPIAERELYVTWGGSTDPEGHAIHYILEGRIDNGAYTQYAKTTHTYHTVTVPNNGVRFQLRIKAVDSEGAESGYVTGPAYTILYNKPPVISGSDMDLGRIFEPFRYSYWVDDFPDDDVVTVTEKLVCAGREFAIRTHVVAFHQEYTVATNDLWYAIPNGSSALVITAVDTYGETTVRTIRFTRQTDRIAAYKMFQTNDPIRACTIGVNGDLPTHCELTNNPYDPEPVWEDATASVNAERYVFVNRNIASAPGFGFRFYLKRAAGEPVKKIKEISTKLEA